MKIIHKALLGSLAIGIFSGFYNFEILKINAEQSFRALSTPDINEIEYPDGFEPKPEEVQLGKALFFDNRLSLSNKISCATCHNPNLGFSDGHSLGIGTKGNKLSRNAPHLYNLAWSSSLFWDGRADSLEQQSLMPIESKNEMSMPMVVLNAKLKKVKYYQENFKKLYSDGINTKNLAKALAAFERTLITNNSDFDKYLKGNKNALLPEAVRGMKLFQGKASCINCHDGANFTDDSFHNIGINDKDLGRGTIVKDKSLNGAFKTPGLRNVLFTAPYMHDGSIKTIEDVIRFYNKGGNKIKNKDKLIKPLKLNEQEIFDLVAFMGSINEEVKIDPPKEVN